jgi:hypothetical protein
MFVPVMTVIAVPSIAAAAVTVPVRVVVIVIVAVVISSCRCGVAVAVTVAVIVRRRSRCAGVMRTVQVFPAVARRGCDRRDGCGPDRTPPSVHQVLDGLAAFMRRQRLIGHDSLDTGTTVLLFLVRHRPASWCSADTTRTTVSVLRYCSSRGRGTVSVTVGVSVSVNVGVLIAAVVDHLDFGYTVMVARVWAMRMGMLMVMVVVMTMTTTMAVVHVDVRRCICHAL